MQKNILIIEVSELYDDDEVSRADAKQSGWQPQVQGNDVPYVTYHRLRFHVALQVPDL